MEFNIVDLVPYETAALQDKVQEKMRKIRDERKMLKPKVAIIDNIPMVKDGNNTVVAYKKLGYRSIECDRISVSGSEIQECQHTLRIRIRQNQIGFNNFPIVTTIAERDCLIRQEMRSDMGGFSMWDNSVRRVM